MQADPFIEPINKAIGSGVSVTTFAADSPKSKRTAYITSDNVAEAKFAADEIVKKLGEKVNMPFWKIRDKAITICASLPSSTIWAAPIRR